MPVLTRFRFALSVGVAAIAVVVAPTAGAQQPPASPPEPEMEEMVVTGVRASIRRAADIEREAATVVTAITADDIGNFADQNVAESLQRAAGITIIRDEGEGRTIRVRGLSSDFSQVLLNGAQLGSSDPGGGRSVALDVISSELLSGITVAKVLTPDLDHDSLGALVELRTLSAFDRPESGVRFRAEGSYNQIGDEVSPKFGGDATWRSADDRFGVAFAFNYFDRELQLDNLRNDVGPPFAEIFRTPTGGFLVDPAATAVPAGSTRFLRPQEADQRVEVGRRERIGATLGLEFRPTDNHRVFVNLIGAQLEDDDLRLQQEVEFRRASQNSNIVAIDGRSGQLTRVDFEKQIFFQDRTDRVWAVNAGGESTMDAWTVSYRFDYSNNRFTLPEGLRGRYRERDVPLRYSATSDSALLEFLPSPNPAVADATQPGNFTFDSILQIDERRTDEILAYGGDVARDVTVFDRPVTVKVGVKTRNREKVIRRGEVSATPSTTANRALLTAAGVPASLAGFELFTPARTDLSSITFFPEREAVSNALELTADVLGLTTEGNGRADYDSSEDVFAGFSMVDASLTDTLNLIAGFRAERTRYTTVGTRIERLERDGAAIGQATSAVQEVGNTYTRVLPSLHLRWDAHDEVVARLSLSRAIVRPEFGAASALQEIDTVQETVAGQVRTVSRTLEGGNPNLEPLLANQVDVSVGWYPNDDSSLTLAGFYKDLNNPFVEADFVGESVASTAFAVFDPATGEGFTAVETTGNAGDGRLLGLEISGNHFLTWLPEPFDGLFASGNITLIDGKVRADQIRNGESFSLPNQPSVTGNVSLGYENSLFSLRWSGNYIGESIDTVDASNPERDELDARFWSMDVNLRVTPFDWLQIYFDAININEANDERFYRGDVNGPLYSDVDDYGRTFQLGVTTNFTF